MGYSDSPGDIAAGKFRLVRSNRSKTCVVQNGYYDRGNQAVDAE
jgi:hypothetical protein